MNSGVIDFSGVVTLTGAVTEGGDWVEFNSSTGGQILFTSVTQIAGQYIRFNLEGASNPFPSLTSLSQGSFSVPAGGTLSFPQLQAGNGFGVSVGAGGVLNLPSATAWTGSSISIADTGVVNAPNVTNMGWSTISLAGTAALNSGMLTNIDNTRFFLSGGAVFDRVAATSYSTTGWRDSITIVSVTGAGSRLDLSSVMDLTVGYYCRYCNGYQRFEALNSGIIDFSGVVTLTGAVTEGGDWVEFNSSTGGQILFTSVTQIAGQYIRFNLEGASNPFPSLTSLNQGSFSVPAGGTLSFPQLQAGNGFGASVGAGGVLNLPSATAWTGSSISVADTGVVNAPNVTNMGWSTISLAGTAALNSGILTNIGNTRFFLSGGAVFDRVAATTYDTTGWSHSITIVSVTGVGSRLDLSSVTDLTVGYRCRYCNGYQRFEALNGGSVDFSGAQTLTGAVTEGGDWVEFVAETSGQILFTALEDLNTRWLRFITRSAGIIDLSALTHIGHTDLRCSADGAGSIIHLESLCTHQGTSFSETNGGDVAHAAVALGDFFDKAIFGVRSDGQTGACTGSTCSTTSLFSFLPHGICLREAGLVKLGADQLDVDGLAASPNYGLLGFELEHNPASGAVLGSRLVAIATNTAVTTVIGTTLTGKEIRGAIFVGDHLYALDVENDELLRVAPHDGSIVGVPSPLSLNTAPFDVSAVSDIAVNKFGEGFLVNNNTWYELDLFTGELTELLVDTQPLSDLQLPGYSGAAFGADPSTAVIKLVGLSTTGVDQLLEYDATMARGVLFQSFSSTNLPDGSLGDLASVSTLDTTAPGPVTITIDPDGDGTTVLLDWTTYDEVANGNDIHHYTIYQSSTSFNHTSQATSIATEPSGTKIHRVNNLARGQQVFFAVTATDNLNNVDPNVTALGTTPNDIVAPRNVQNLSVTSFETSLGLNWQPSPDNDVTHYRVYVNSNPVASNIPVSTLSYTAINLTPSTGYQIRVTAVDGSNNESSGVQVSAATWLPNPGNVVLEGGDSKAIFTWSGVQPANLLSGYKLYVEANPFSSIVGLTAKGSVSAGANRGEVAGLANNTTYYAAVTAVNISQGERANVASQAVTPTADLIGPTFSNTTYGGAPLGNSFVVTRSGAISTVADDPSGVARVEFAVDDGNGYRSLGIDTSGPTYTAFWDITAYPDAPYTLRIRGVDTLANVSELFFNVTVTMAPPAAPTITAPPNSTQTSVEQIEVLGLAELNTQVYIFRDTFQVAGPLAVDALGGFRANITLLDGVNVLTAEAEGRGGRGPESSPVSVTLDRNIPDAPSGFSATSRLGGEVYLSWGPVSGTTPITYNVYRAANSFTTRAAAQKLNAQPIVATNYTDLPAADGDYYYRVEAVNAAQTASELSLEVIGRSDRAAPQATSITYQSSGNVDPLTGRMAPGLVTVSVVVSEPLLVAPFFSIGPAGGFPISVPLSRQTDLDYTGNFTIASSTPSGVAHAVFSARDRAGNRGTNILSGGSLLIDTDGPNVTVLTINPSSPIKNDPVTPVTVGATFTVSEAPALSTTPDLKYLLSGAGRQPTDITNVTPTNAQRTAWSASFTLPADAGQGEAESLVFLFEAEDDLGNVSTKIDAPNEFQVYQGNLPPLEVPVGLRAQARPAGKVFLEWNAVADAVGYQLYRKDPTMSGSSPLIEYGSELTVTNFEDVTTADGEHQYAVASVRRANGQEAKSAQSAPVIVIADSTAPNAPENLALELLGQGVKATWDEPQGGVGANGVVTYSLYRDNLAPNVPLDPTGLTPIVFGVTGLETYDVQPSELEHAYAVVAVDEAGNASVPSNTEYLNFALLPIESFQIQRQDTAAPYLNWYHPSATVTDYRVELLDGSSTIPLQTGPQTDYTDTGFTGGERRYQVVAIDANSVESVARTLMLPDVVAELPAQYTLKRGVFNQLDYIVHNRGTTPLIGVTLEVTLHGNVHTSDPFTLSASEQKSVPVIVGGVDSLGAVEELETTIHYRPEPGSSVQISTKVNLPVANAALTLSVDTMDMIRGAQGKVRFSVENTSAVLTEIITARQTGNAASNEVRLKLIDSEQNVYTVLPIKQFLGANVITIITGDTVARVAPNATFTSDWFDIDIPSNVPTSARIELEIDKFHSALGTTHHAEIEGHGTVVNVTLDEQPYGGEIISVIPQNSYGDEDVTIIGRAVDPANQALAHTPLDLILRVNGFETKETIHTNVTGEFSHLFTPQAGRGGRYTVSAVYPGSLDRPEQAEFTVAGLSLVSSRFDVRIPLNYETSFNIDATSYFGSAATNVRLEYRAEDQPTLSLPVGVFVTLPQAVPSLDPSQSHRYTVRFGGDNTANLSGMLRLRMMSDTSGARVLAFVDVTYQFSAAAPSLFFNPTVLETGVGHNQSVTENITLGNNGLAAVTNAQLELLERSTQQPAPNWIYITSAQTLGLIEIGAQHQIALIVNPDSAVLEGYHEFLLRVTADGNQTLDLPILVAVTQSGVGNFLVHVSDIYTATLNSSNQVIPGLEDAQVKLLHENVSSIEYVARTDNQGEILFQGVTAGNYILRASAPDHDDIVQRVRIRPGITNTEEVFLMNSIVVIEWSVREIGLGDRYEIILNAVFQTNVPVAVLVLEPAGTQLPDLLRGQIFYGELRLTNYGLVRAESVTAALPTSDEKASYEFLASIPNTLEANQVVVIPYRVTALQDFNPSGGGDSTGGGGCTYVQQACVNALSHCANNYIAQVGSCSYWLNTKSCTSPPNPSGIGGGSSSGGGGGSSLVPGGNSLEDLGCVPGIPCDEAVEEPVK
ncbi:fibronectin type III domain-containing protein [Oligoflexia bacterium]|nr:fibronectin type III domain-containing protein [Oligoflexia bacterium]